MAGKPVTTRLRVRGEPSGPFPLTWGQQAIWAAIGRTVPNDHYFNFSRVLTVPQKVRPATPERVVAALESVVARHSSLRTKLLLDGEIPLQATDTGEIPVVMGDEVAELTAATFDYTGEFPLRVGLVLDKERAVTEVVLAFCHLAADGHGADIVLRDLRLALLGRTGPAAGSVPETVRYQRSERGRQQSDAVVSYWAQAYAKMPVSMFPVRRAEPQPVRYWVARLTSPALELACQVLAARHGVSTTAVLMAATASVVCADSAQPMAAILPIVSNRFTPEHRDLVTTLSQEGLFLLDTSGALTFEDLLAPAWKAGLQAYRMGLYDPVAHEAALARVSEERGETVHPYCCFNDMRLADQGRAHGVPEMKDFAESKLEWAAPQERVSCRFCLHVTRDGDALVVQLTGDTAYLPPDRLMAMLSTLESLIVDSVATK